VKGFLPWLGGKHYLAKRIAPIIDGIPHTCYVEPFMGGAHVFFRRRPAKTEVINDLNSELVVLFRVLQWHLEEFLRYFKWALVSRAEFTRQLRVPPETLTDIQRAARFYYLQKSGVGGMATAFGTSTTGRPRINLVRLEEELSAVHLRLTNVTIENLPWQECVRRYDRPHTVFYLDPPYYGVEHYYGRGLFRRDDFADMVGLLAQLRGRFVLSLNDRPEVRKLFKGFHMITVATKYSAGQADRSKPVLELLISSEPLGG
jgi:DNA adenine methylase